jgi:hypothetical protein
LVKFESFIFLFRRSFKIKNLKSINDILLAPYLNEDFYLTQTLGNIFYDYKVATTEQAIKFSFEVNPSLLYEINNNQLPFGCHAWEKNDPDFWKQFIT